MRLSHFAVPAALGASLLVGVAGCESDSDKPLAYESKPLRDDARGEIPAGATVMKQGHEPLLFEAPSDGTVWIYNASDERLVYTAGLRHGQNIEVDPDHDFVTVDGRKVVDTKMDDFDKHQVLFAPASPLTASPAAPASVTVQPNPVTIQQQPAEIRVKPNEVEVQPSGVRVTPSN